MAEFKASDFDDYESLHREITSRYSLDDGCPGCRITKRVLMSSKDLEEVLIRLQENHPDIIDGQSSLATTITKLGTNALEDIYVSLIYQQYISGYRSVRYLYEVYLVLKGVNHNPDWAVDIWKTFEIEIESLVGNPTDWPLFPYEHIEELGRLRDSEKDLMKNDFEKMDDLYNRLSKQANHPLRMEKAYTQGNHSPALERDIGGFGLWLFVGLVSEYYRAFGEDEFPPEYEGALNKHCQAVADIHGEVPRFLFDYFDLIPTSPNTQGTEKNP